MATITVAQLYGEQPAIDIALAAHWPAPKPDNIWANYDADTDSLILYLTGKPVRGIHVWLGDGVNVIVAPDTHQVVGLYIEAWERQFVPEHVEIQQVWPDIKPTTQQHGWSQLLRMLAVWLFLIFQPPPDDASTPQPA